MRPFASHLGNDGGAVFNPAAGRFFRRKLECPLPVLADDREARLQIAQSSKKILSYSNLFGS
jgi:hypothetical protein